jgi:hypothetical protein
MYVCMLHTDCDMKNIKSVESCVLHASLGHASQWYVQIAGDVLNAIIIRHKISLHRPVWASSNSLLKGVPSRLRPFGL